MSFKKLNINRALIDECIKNFVSKNGSISINRIPKNNQYIYNIETPNEGKAILSIYHNNDGTTTLYAKDGKNPEYSEKIANHIKVNCCFDEVKSKDFYFKDLQPVEYETIIDYLVQECECEVIQENNIPHGKQKKIKSKQGDVLSFNYYNKGSLHIQGTPRLLFRDTIDILSELFPEKYKDIIEQQLKFYEADLTTDQVLTELENRMPSAFGEIRNKIKSVISPSLTLLKIQVELTDYFAFASPALKGLEGVLKQIFAENGIHINRDGFSEHYEYSNGKHILNANARNSIKDVKTQQVLADLYNYFRAKRHELFHMDGNVELSKTLSRNEAEDIIHNTLNIIENAFVTLSN